MGNVSLTNKASGSNSTYTTNTNDTNTLARTATVLLERRVQRNTTAHHRRGLSRRDSLRNGKDKVVVATPVLGVTAVSLLARGPFAVVSVGGLHGAVVLGAHGAALAVSATVQTCAGLGADTDAVADFDAVGDIFANADGLADDFVADDARVLGWSPAAGKS